MTTTCPKCAYVRQPTDAAPDYECPRCGIIYAKYRPSTPLDDTPSSIRPAPSWKRPLIVFAIVVAAIAGWQWNATANKERLAAETKAAADVAAREAARAREEADLAERKRAEENMRAVEKAVFAVALQRSKWSDASTLASSTARIALSGPVANLQTLRRETQAMIVPPCLDRAKATLLEGMGKEIEGFVIFMQNPAQLGDLLAQAPFAEAKHLFGNYEAALGECEGAEGRSGIARS